MPASALRSASCEVLVVSHDQPPAGRLFAAKSAAAARPAARWGSPMLAAVYPDSQNDLVHRTLNPPSWEETLYCRLRPRSSRGRLAGRCAPTRSHRQLVWTAQRGRAWIYGTAFFASRAASVMERLHSSSVWSLTRKKAKKAGMTITAVLEDTDRDLLTIGT